MTYLLIILALAAFFYGVRAIARWERSGYSVKCPRCNTQNKVVPGACPNCTSTETEIRKGGNNLLSVCRKCKNSFPFFAECTSCKTDLTGMVYAKIPNPVRLPGQ
jgi:primosomal protein N'